MTSQSFEDYVPRVVLVLSAIVLFCTIATGCGGSIGPVVTNVSWRANGELEVERCYLDISSIGNVTTYSMHDCKRAAVPRPAAVAPAPAADPPTWSR